MLGKDSSVSIIWSVDWWVVIRRRVWYVRCRQSALSSSGSIKLYSILFYLMEVARAHLSGLFLTQTCKRCHANTLTIFAPTILQVCRCHHRHSALLSGNSLQRLVVRHKCKVSAAQVLTKSLFIIVDRQILLFDLWVTTSFQGHSAWGETMGFSTPSCETWEINVPIIFVNNRIQYLVFPVVIVAQALYRNSSSENRKWSSSFL